MANVRINDLPPVSTMSPTMKTAVDSASTQSATIQQLVDTGAPVASQADAEGGVDNVKRMTALTTRQAIEAQGAGLFASTAQGTKADTAVQPTRAITAGTGLTGGGDLSADRAVSLNAGSIASLAKADTAVQPADLIQYVSVSGANAELQFTPIVGYPDIYSLELVTGA